MQRNVWNVSENKLDIAGFVLRAEVNCWSDIHTSKSDAFNVLGQGFSRIHTLNDCPFRFYEEEVI